MAKVRESKHAKEDIKQGMIREVARHVQAATTQTMEATTMCKVAILEKANMLMNLSDLQGIVPEAIEYLQLQQSEELQMN
jgi:membrane protease subunit (stomatin/prohibitin family)